MAASQKNIVVLGASFAGLSVSHYFLKHILPSLNARGSSQYHVYLISPSSHWYWRIGAPRAMVAKDLIPHSTSFMPIAEGFEKYDKNTFSFIQGSATAVDVKDRNVTYALSEGGKSHNLPYHALVLATGTRTPIMVTSTTGSHKDTIAALDNMQAEIGKAKSVIIVGGGPAGVETAGEIGEYLNGTPGLFGNRPKSIKCKITLISGSNKLLPMLRPALAQEAERLLARVGVDLIHNTKMTGTSKNDDGTTTVTLEDGKKLSCDVYIPCTGVTPNTEFLPDHIKNEKGYVKTNEKTLRVDEAGPRVYCAGDVGTYTRGGVLDIFDAIPVVMTNMKRDLFAYERAASGQTAANGDVNGAAFEPADTKPKGEDRSYARNEKENQLVPVGRTKGVGAFNGNKVPSLMVYLIKGRNYLISTSADLVSGDKWNKETGWKVTDA